MQELQESWVRSLGQENPLEWEWQPTSVFLPGKSHGHRSLAGYSPWGCKQSDATEQAYLHFPALGAQSPDLWTTREVQIFNSSHTVSSQRSSFIINDTKQTVWSSKTFHAMRRKVKQCRLVNSIREKKKLLVNFKSYPLQHHFRTATSAASLLADGVGRFIVCTMYRVCDCVRTLNLYFVHLHGQSCRNGF